MGKTFEEHLSKLKEVLTELGTHLQLNPEKYGFSKSPSLIGTFL